MKGEDRGPLFLTFPLLGKDRGGGRKKRGAPAYRGPSTKCRASLRYNLLSRRLQLTSLDDVTFRSRLISNRAV